MASEEEFSSYDRAMLETLVASGYVDPPTQGAAKAELSRRDRDYTETQEISRREYEDQREASRREFEVKVFVAAGNRAAVQQEHEEKLARMQADAAREAATIQAQATEHAAERQVRVARWSAYAAMGAAIAALISLVVTAATPLLTMVSHH